MSQDKTLLTISLVEREGRLVILDHAGGLTAIDDYTAIRSGTLRQLSTYIANLIPFPPIEREAIRKQKHPHVVDLIPEPDIPSPQDAWRSERGL